MKRFLASAALSLCVYPLSLPAQTTYRTVEEFLSSRPGFHETPIVVASLEDLDEDGDLDWVGVLLSEEFSQIAVLSAEEGGLFSVAGQSGLFSPIIGGSGRAWVALVEKTAKNSFRVLVATEASYSISSYKFSFSLGAEGWRLVSCWYERDGKGEDDSSASVFVDVLTAEFFAKLRRGDELLESSGRHRYQLHPLRDFDYYPFLDLYELLPNER